MTLLVVFAFSFAVNGVVVTDAAKKANASANATSSEATKTEKVSSVKYKTKKLNYTKKFKSENKKYTIKDTEYIKKVILTGSSDAVKKINKQMNKEYKYYIKNMPKGKYAKAVAKDITANAEYQATYDTKVSYNDNGVVSFVISFGWYQGGVTDSGAYGYTFDLNTGKALKLKDVCKGTNKSLTKKIKSSLKKNYKKAGFDKDLFKKIKANKANFFIEKDGNVTVMFNKYEIADGASGVFEVSIPSIYK
ncbi:MAG: DUF3298 and DUF4163 domain-containing protein [Lachnospiraceae bacterium]|nr:DUF3298 and DUF4163 domain-containing protein [Lachnospiraceae bacterium]